MVNATVVSQITLDDDYNVPEQKEDVEKLIQSKGIVEIKEIEAMVGRIKIKGELSFQLLYGTTAQEQNIDALTGTLPFEEILVKDGVTPTDVIKARAYLEDLNISIINSRKLSIQALISLKAIITSSQRIEATTSVDDMGQLQVLPEQMNRIDMMVNKKDVYRIRQEVQIPSNKPNIYQVLWYSMNVSNLDIKPLDGKISMKGDIGLFVMYITQEEHIPVQYLELEIPMQGQLECEECKEDMISNILVNLVGRQLMVKPNEEGEERVIELEASLELDIKLYEENQMAIIKDAYEPNKCVKIEDTPFTYESLLVKNSAKTRVSQRAKHQEKDGKMMQICHVEGCVRVDQMEQQKDGINVSGVVVADVLYICENDKHPFRSFEVLVPFDYLVEAENIKPGDSFDVNTELEQIAVMMLDDQEIEVKAIIRMDAIVFQQHQGNAVQNIEICDISSEELEAKPTLVGYIVKNGETLWDIAKRYDSTIQNIVKINELERPVVKEGDKLIVM